jgi:NAD(P)-dependent dehydrogenase (short-subunit alcohol dehydrogenase family)
MELNLSGKRALVTGSTLGIGRAIAENLIREGAEVVINSRDPDRVKAAVQELEGLGSVTGVVADLSSADGVDALISEIPNIDILVNNAGFFEVKPFFEIEDAEWFDMFELNVMSGVRLSRTFMQGMLDRDWGRIVFIGSDQSSKPNPAMAHYAMTKTAQVSVARSLAELTKGTGVTVNTVQVAPTWTDGVEAFLGQLAEIDDTTVDEMSRAYFEEGEGQTSLLQRWAKPEEIANVVAFLCSPKASAINGAAPRADGGMVRSLF